MTSFRTLKSLKHVTLLAGQNLRGCLLFPQNTQFSFVAALYFPEEQAGSVDSSSLALDCNLAICGEIVCCGLLARYVSAFFWAVSREQALSNLP